MIKEVNGFRYLIGSDGAERLIVESSKIDQCIQYIIDGNVKSITINSFQGYDGDNLDFLIKLQDVLEELHIPDIKFRTDVVNKLHRLKSLGIADNGIDVIDLTNFPKLMSLAVDFSPRLIGLEKCHKLRNLTLTGYKAENLCGLPLCVNLQELYLFKTNIASLKGIEKYKNLKKLQLFSASKLESISSLTDLGNLVEIEIERCKKIKDFEILGSLKLLKKIMLNECGEIGNLSFIRKWPKLDFISFWGTNVLDGNLAYCDNVKYVGFDDKRHYTHKWVDRVMIKK